MSYEIFAPDTPRVRRLLKRLKDYQEKNKKEEYGDEIDKYLDN